MRPNVTGLPSKVAVVFRFPRVDAITKDLPDLDVTGERGSTTVIVLAFSLIVTFIRCSWENTRHTSYANVTYSTTDSLSDANSLVQRKTRADVIDAIGTHYGIAVHDGGIRVWFRMVHYISE